VLGTLIVVTALTPVKDRLQVLVDQRFKEGADPARRLRAFGEQVRSRVTAVEARQVMRRLLEEAVAAFGATSGAVYWLDDGKLDLRVTVGEWRGDAAVSVDLATRQNKFGEIRLGPRRNGAAYTAKDRAALDDAARVVAQAIEQDQSSIGVPLPAKERA
jgi:hypothetical protein